MKLLKKAIEKDGSGFVTLIPEEDEDMWHIYNLIQEGDTLRSTTVRRVVSESITGSTNKNSVRTNMSIVVVSVFFDVQVCTLRVNGKCVEQNPVVKMGSFHTIDLELNRSFTLKKDCWDFIALDRIHEACDVAQRAEIAAVVMQEGLANLCLVTNNMTIVRQKVEKTIPRKRKGGLDGHEKAIERFFEQIYQGLLKSFNYSVLKVMLICSPGFLKDQFFEFLKTRLQKDLSSGSNAEAKALQGFVPKVVLAQSTSGHKQALQDALSTPHVMSLLANTKYAQETLLLERFYKMLNDDASRAYYGYDHVHKAAEMGAIECLLITDSLFRAADIVTRKKYVKLVEMVTKAQGKVLLFSSLHVSGEQLALLSGIACITLFPCPDIEEEIEREQT